MSRIKSLSYLSMLLSSNKKTHGLILFMNYFPDRDWEIGVMRKEKEDDNEDTNRVICSYEGKKINFLVDKVCEDIEKFLESEH